MKLIQKGLPSKRRTFLFGLKRLLSYLWPITIERCPDEPDLKLVLEDGRMVVNKGAANYSFGQLQAAFAEFFDRKGPDWSNISDVLILGYGAGSVADLIENKQPNASITGIEINSCMIDWQETHFQKEGRRVIQSDALEFVANTTDKYDLVIVDIFHELDVPDPFRTSEFIVKCKELLNVGGALVYNFVIDREEHRSQYSDLIIQISNVFRSVESSEHFTVNRIIFAK